MFRYLNRIHAELFQWDTDIRLQFEGTEEGQEISFTNDGVTCYGRIVDNNQSVVIPNILLQSAKPIDVYYYVNKENVGQTISRTKLNVLPRPKPEDYINEEVDIPKWSTKLDKFFGEEYAGLYLKIDDDGSVIAAPGGGGGGASYDSLPIASTSQLGAVRVGNNLSITANGVLSVITTDEAAEDNSKPITGAAVHTLIGNIDALLSGI